jgi:DNA invertase Pin-like site-specific DNA recombinase
MKKNRYATKAIILARVSTEDQAENDHYSIPAQLRNMQEYVKNGGRFKTLKEIVEEILIEGESAFKGKRSQFRQTLEIVEKHDEPIAVIFDVVDRFSRRYDELLEFDKLREEGMVELHFVNQGFQGLVIHRNSTQEELATWEEEVTFARKFSRKTSANVRRSIREKLQSGKFPGGLVPVGYVNTKQQTENGRFVKKIEVDKEKARFVRKCFTLFSTGKYTLETLTKEMRRLGFTTKTKKIRSNGQYSRLKKREPKLVTETDIYGILTNPFYFGKFNYLNHETGERELFPAEGLATNYEPIMDSFKVFEKVQKLLNRNNTRKNGFKHNSFKFAKLLTCRFCGATLTAEEMSRTYKDKSNPNASINYYHCTSARAANDPDWYRREFGTDHSGVRVGRNGSKREGQTIYNCPQLWWKEEEIEQAILNELENVEYGEEVYEWFRETLKEEYGEEADLLEEQIATVRKKYAKNEELTKALVKNMAMENDPDLKEAFRAEWQEMKRDQQSLRDEIDELESAKELNIDSLVDALRYCSNLRDQYLNLDDDKKRDFLEIIFSEISPHRGWIVTKKNKGRKAESNDVRFFYNEPFATLKTLNLVELDRQEFEAGRLPHFPVKKEEKKDLTKKKETKAFPKP